MLYIVGMGPGNIKFLTREAIETIKEVDEIITFGRIAETAKLIRTPIQCVKSLTEIVSLIDPSKDTAILASGDACFFGILDYLQKTDVAIDLVVPGITSFQYLMNRLRKSWHNASFASLHGREQDLASIAKQKMTVILTDKKNTPDSISQKLYKLGARGEITVGYNLSYDDEIIIEEKIGVTIPHHSELSTIVVEIDSCV
ncbi:precorrin-6y C5,15-methyltransferase (decarboxylating) subunit CbiE [bacterium]|nr:precorrin-6y C5,15-methyltransferase (decarboxylating) subunit CbiE [bacterium]